MLSFIEHIAIAAADPAALAGWYCDALGFEMLSGSQASRTYFVKLGGGGILEILPANDQPRPDRADDDAGITHIAFAVEDFDATYAALQQKGIRLSPVNAAPDGKKLAFFTDPEGNQLQLAYRPEPL